MGNETVEAGGGLVGVEHLGRDYFASKWVKDDYMQAPFVIVFISLNIDFNSVKCDLSQVTSIEPGRRRLDDQSVLLRSNLLIKALRRFQDQRLGRFLGFLFAVERFDDGNCELDRGTRTL